MNETMTIPEALEATIQLLGEIQVPMNLFEQIGGPINGAIGNLRACVYAMRKAELERKAEQAKEEAK